jgi:DNA repair protein RecN (Recombination protein N)
VAAISGNRTGTLVFDEVDTGVGGRVAELVGQQLRALGQNAQVLCVTHLPQVASQGNHHFLVSKRTVAGETSTAVEALSPAQRVEELARMLGGLKITSRTREHAEEMLTAAKVRKAS